ncbi:iso-IS1 ORF1 [Shigella dysenteriae Sd197]|uniref:Iso-IS1 ORF1 n=1 Tax=Shigella dysenteriae serotype 1 (strain Sd197) TaxID=300267 RepID=Q32I59_SHIDS|nr:IS1 family transposase [Shigella dysenteriae]ABB60998.1 iso-IS1 ORF1 [Shigella dysenteriae Sd197]
MASVNIHCPRCQSAQVYRHGQNPKGHDRFRCRDCHRVFQLTYTYEARKPGIKELITEMAFNGAGVLTMAVDLCRLTTRTMNVNAGHERTSKARIIHQIQLIRGITQYY